MTTHILLCSIFPRLVAFTHETLINFISHNSQKKRYGSSIIIHSELMKYSPTKVSFHFDEDDKWKLYLEFCPFDDWKNFLQTSFGSIQFKAIFFFFTFHILQWWVLRQAYLNMASRLAPHGMAHRAIQVFLKAIPTVG